MKEAVTKVIHMLTQEDFHVRLCRSCWNGTASAFQPEEITSKGTRVSRVCTINKSGLYEKKSGNLFNDPRNSNPQNYRPIALTSCVCQTMKRVINKRLTRYQESHNLITNLQKRFFKKRGTVDHLIRLETFARETLIKKQHPKAFFFSDTIPLGSKNIMRDLHDVGLRAGLPLYLKLSLP